MSKNNGIKYDVSKIHNFGSYKEWRIWVKEQWKVENTETVDYNFRGRARFEFSSEDKKDRQFQLHYYMSDLERTGPGVRTNIKTLRKIRHNNDTLQDKALEVKHMEIP